MEFKELPMKVQLVVSMMQTVGILESMCEQQNLSQQQFERAVTDTFLAAGIDPLYVQELTDGLTDEENFILEEFMASVQAEDESDDSENEPKVH